MMGNMNKNTSDMRSSVGSETKPESNKQKIQLNQEELRARLTPIQYAVTQEKATER